jgi:cytoskeleton protein RodZ
MRGISLDEIVASTKIGTRLLRALENEQFDLLPGGIFNKSYVRAYAKCVGMDEEEAVAAYMEAANEAPPDNRVIAHQASFHGDRLPEPTGFPIVPVLILLVVIVGGIAGWKVYRDHVRDREVRAITPDQAPAASTTTPDAGNSAPQTPPASTTTPPANAGETAQRPAPVSGEPVTKPAQSPSASTTSAATGTADAAAGPAFEVVIRPKDSAWVSVKSDGKFVVRGIIRPPDVKTIRATSQVVFWTGNAGAVEVSFNGKSVPLPGDANQEGVLVFDSRGVMQHPPRAAEQ